MPDDELGEAQQSIQRSMVMWVQGAAQIFSSFVQIRLLAQRQRDAATEAAASAAAAQIRASYAADAARFAPINDDTWWDEAGPDDIREATAAAWRWSSASPEAAAAARRAADRIRDRGLAELLGIDIDALARARVDPEAARHFGAAMSDTPAAAAMSSDNDPNTAFMKEAFGDRAAEFVYQPQWHYLSAQIDAAIEDGRYDVVDLLREGDQWRPYTTTDGDRRRDRAGLLAWRLENFLSGNDQKATLTRRNARGLRAMNPQPRNETVIDGEVINRESASATPSVEQEQVAYLAAQWPDAAAQRLLGSPQWPQIAASLANLRRDGADVAAGLLGPDGVLDEHSVSNPAAAYVLVFDPRHPDQPPTVSARGPRNQDANPDPQARQAEASGEAASPANPDHASYAAAVRQRWPDAAESMISGPRWEELVDRFDRMRAAGADVANVITNARYDLSQKRNPAAYLLTVIDAEHIARIEAQDALRHADLARAEAAKRRAADRATPRQDRAVVDEHRRAENRRLFDEAREAARRRGATDRPPDTRPGLGAAARSVAAACPQPTSSLVEHRQAADAAPPTPQNAQSVEQSHTQR
jgi:hypothetical protein